MDLRLPLTGLARYKSASQRARACTEPWAEANLYCPACDSRRISTLPIGTRAADFICPGCDSRFQLKRSRPGRCLFGHACRHQERQNSKPLPASLSASAALGRGSPSHPALRFQPVPSSKTKAAFAKCSPCWMGWLQFPSRPHSGRREDSGDRIRKSYSVRRSQEAYQRVRPLEKLTVERRGWTLDVLNVVRSLAKREFQLSDVYARSHELAELHPQNRHVNDKIRQQLQVLRDMRLLEFLSPGHYRLR